MKTYQEVKSCAEERKSDIKAGEFGDVVEIEFFDAHMEIRWAFVERHDEFVIVLAEHYPPIFQHVDETVWFEQRTFDGEVVKRWENQERMPE